MRDKATTDASTRASPRDKDSTRTRRTPVKRGPEPERLKLPDEDWREAVRKVLKAPAPRRKDAGA
jgi:hypothetical protein